MGFVLNIITGESICIEWSARNDFRCGTTDYSAFVKYDSILSSFVNNVLFMLVHCHACMH